MYLRSVSSSSAERRRLGRAGGGYLSGMPGVLMTCLYPCAQPRSLKRRRRDSIICLTSPSSMSVSSGLKCTCVKISSVVCFKSVFQTVGSTT